MIKHHHIRPNSICSIIYIPKSPIQPHEETHHQMGDSHVSSSPNPDPPYRIFGYGSLIWKPIPFGVVDRIPCYVDTHVRRFWQLSEDHRGTPAAPGRVVTLLPTPAYTATVASLPDTQPHAVTDHPSRYGIHPDLSRRRTYGVVYVIGAGWVDRVREYLGVREVNGYGVEKVSVTVVGGGGKEQMEAEVYIGGDQNPQYAPLLSLTHTAQHIHRACGPSGPNKEYLYSLREALRTLAALDDELDEGGEAGGHEDRYVEELYRLVKALDEKQEGGCATD
ncbi:hypothetical protein PYCC9005_001351 [Savitreella phatthalungensis]